MKIEYLDHGLLQCYYIRISGDSDLDFIALKNALNKAHDNRTPYELSSTPPAYNRCIINLSLFEQQDSLSQSSDSHFTYKVSEQGFNELCKTIDSLITDNGFKWLNTHSSNINLLICRHEHGFT